MDKIEQLRYRGWALWPDVASAATGVALARDIVHAYGARADAVIADPGGSDIFMLGAVAPNGAANLAKPLGFAMGHPIADTNDTKSFCMALALYQPESAVACALETRLVFVPELLDATDDQRGSGDAEARLQRYARAHARTPARWGAGGCIALLAEFLEASRRDSPDLSEHGAAASVLPQVRDATGAETREQAYFSAFGADLGEHEVRVLLEPGDLLVVDNLQCAHGFAGPYRSAPLVECLLGTRGFTAKMKNALMRWWARHLASLNGHSEAVPAA